MTRTGLRLLAVDLDGTLVDSAPDIAHCLGNALTAVGFAAPGEALTRSWIGDGIETLIARALGYALHEERAVASGADAALRRTALEAFLVCYADHLFVHSRLYPGAVETLDAFRAAGVTLCCVTNKRHSFSDTLLAQAGVRDRFALVVGGDSLPEKKPSPLPLEFASERLGVDPAEAMLVGDSTPDLMAARGAGFRFAYASYGYGNVEDRQLGSSLRLREFSDLRALLAA